MPRAGPRKVRQYSLEFKLKAVKLSQLEGVEVQAVADALEIHPFMLSRWRKEARDGVLRGRVSVPKAVKAPLHLRTKADVFAFIEQEREAFGVTRLCRLFAVSRPGFYAWRARPESPRRREDRVRLEDVRAIFENSGGTYGTPRVRRALRARGHRLSGRRVAHLMREDGLRGRLVRVYRPKAGTHRWFGQHPNHVKRTQATRLNRIWVGDLTYIAVDGRWWYLAAVLDQCSRRVLAWRLANVRDSCLTRAMVDAAIRRRRPAAGLIFHSDRGSEYLGTPFRDHLAANGVRQSMTRGGAPGENAHMESFFHSLTADVIHGRSFQTVIELRQVLRRDVQYYNHQRLHSALEYQSPVDYERRAA